MHTYLTGLNFFPDASILLYLETSSLQFTSAYSRIRNKLGDPLSAKRNAGTSAATGMSMTYIQVIVGIVERFVLWDTKIIVNTY